MSTMTEKERALLYSHINSCNHYLEFGSGDSTIYAVNIPSVKSIDSVESSKLYIDERLKPIDSISNAVCNGKLSFHLIDIGETVEWGYPKDKSKKHLWPNYSLTVFAKPSNHDLVLVDGRFRVACTLSSIICTKENCIIMIHDFWNRPRYHIVLKYLEVIDSADTLSVFQKKKNINTDQLQKLLEKYQYHYDDITPAYMLRTKLAETYETLSPLLLPLRYLKRAAKKGLKNLNSAS